MRWSSSGGADLKSAVAIVALAAMLPWSCAYAILEPTLGGPGDIPEHHRGAAELKLHMRSGALYVLSSWKVDAETARIDAKGVLYTAARQTVSGQGPYSIAVDDVVLVETNTHHNIYPGGLGALVVLTTVFGGLAAICTVDPKSCFGSCPTFYLGEDDMGRPLAEGFSASVARALEARDLDALRLSRPGGGRMTLTMRNEALETQAVRQVRLVAVPRDAGRRVLADPRGRFFTIRDAQRPTACRAPEGDCRDAVMAFDGLERSSLTDPDDLATRETVELVFPALEGHAGIVIGGRQTLLSTYLFYQTMAYLGRDAGSFLAALERGGADVAEQAMGMARALGDVQVAVAQGDGPWTDIGVFDEAGPIAGDVRVLPFPASGVGPLRVRLRLAKGHWRLDEVALARLEPAGPARVLDPVLVEHKGTPDPRALALLQDRDRHLVALPGDSYRVAFDLPEAPQNLELFLESEGFYYEWMRAEWLAEEDPAMVALILADPDKALRRLAADFKRHEPDLEGRFWSSRFRK